MLTVKQVQDASGNTYAFTKDKTTTRERDKFFHKYIVITPNQTFSKKQLRAPLKHKNSSQVIFHE